MSIEEAAQVPGWELDILIAHAPLLSGVLDADKVKLGHSRAWDSSVPDHGDSPGGWL